MAIKNLTIIHNPNNYIFMCDSHKIEITRKNFLNHIFRYDSITYYSTEKKLSHISLRTFIMLKMLGRGSILIHFSDSIEENFSNIKILKRIVRYLLKVLIRFIKKIGRFLLKIRFLFKKIKNAIHYYFHYYNRELLIREVKNQVRVLANTVPSKGNKKTLDLSKPPAYLRTILSFNVRAGGSVGHISGILNNLGYFTPLPLFLTTDYSPMVKKEIETFLIKPQKKFMNMGVELWYMNSCGTFIKEALSILKNTKPSFIYQRCSLFDYSGAKLSRLLGVPFVFEYNGSEVWVCRNWGNPLKYESLARDIEVCNFKAADLIVVVSKPLQDELMERGIEQDKILLNPNGVDPDIYSPEVDGTEVRNKYALSDKTVLGFIGTFGRWHGAEVLAEAFGVLLNTYPGYKDRVRLLMIGDGLTMPLVKENLKKHTVDDFSILTGLRPQEEGPQYLAACDILVSPHVPNPDGTPFFGSPTKLFEYMATGKGIVASDMDQIGEILEHKKTAWLVKPHDIDALVEGLKMLIDNRELRISMGQAARKEVVEKYTWKEHTGKIIVKLKEIVNT